MGEGCVDKCGSVHVGRRDGRTWDWKVEMHIAVTDCSIKYFGVAAHSIRRGWCSESIGWRFHLLLNHAPQAGCFLTQILSVRSPEGCCCTSHPPLRALKDRMASLVSLTRPMRTAKATRVDRQVIIAARRVVVEQLHPNVLVLSSHLSCQGMGQICLSRTGESK